MTTANQTQDINIKIGQFIIAEADVERTTEKAILFKFTYRADRENAFYATFTMWAPKSATMTEGDALLGFSPWFERKIEQELYTRN
jgi:hypothetical protein